MRNIAHLYQLYQTEITLKARNNQKPVFFEIWKKILFLRLMALASASISLYGNSRCSLWVCLSVCLWCVGLYGPWNLCSSGHRSFMKICTAVFYASISLNPWFFLWFLNFFYPLPIKPMTALCKWPSHLISCSCG